MEFDELFRELETRFSAMVAAAAEQQEANALELRLVGGLPHEIAGRAGRILLFSPQFGADYISGIDASNGNWWAFRIDLVREYRRLSHREFDSSAPSELTFSALNLAEMMGEWLTPLRLKVFIGGDSQLLELRITSISDRAIGVSHVDGAVEVPIANLRAVRANLAELTNFGTSD